MLSTVDDVVGALGGNSAVASLAGVGPPAVSNWKARGRIPSDKFLIFEGALRKLDMRVDPSLFGFETAGAPG